MKQDLRIYDCFYYAICVQCFEDGSCVVIDPPAHIRAAHQLQMLSIEKSAHEGQNRRFNLENVPQTPTAKETENTNDYDTNDTITETADSHNWMNHFWCLKKRKHVSVEDFTVHSKLTFPRDILTT